MPSQPKAQTTLPTTTTTTSPTFQKLSAKASAGMAYNKIVIYKNEDGNFFAVEFKTPKLYLCKYEIRQNLRPANFFKDSLMKSAHMNMAFKHFFADFQ